MDDNGPSRPLGWWLKEADACIDAGFESALAATGLDRRRWQLLASLAHEPRSRSGLAAALRRFHDVATVDAIVDDLASRGLVVARASGMVELTADSRAGHADAAELVGGVRARVAE